MCAEVDEIWHEFILQTSEYKTFCEEYLPGRRFIHHSSISKEDYQKDFDISDRQFFEQQMSWLGYHNIFFGDYRETEMDHWKCTDFLYNSLNLSIDEINYRSSCIANELSQKIS
ncbi:hypothetical protein YC6258_05175 [Gynuella sunshinyii YC6258]|uniref:Uncharacterized protein n=1 Tax=Gynuella sunshinyii YC6258 TaxID=1445510 RepID=A0A0C5VCZ6_9GAMM|nr:hypothetical protein YC6258_05175 [Gynuella sunshinyii YC6258]